AWSVTSRPPCRSSPSVGRCSIGDPGMASSATPTRAAATRPTTKIAARRVMLAAVERFGTLLDLRLHDFLGDDNTVFIIRALRRFRGLLTAVLVDLIRLVVGLDHAGDGATRDAHPDALGDLDDQVVLLVDLVDDAVDAAHRQDLVARLDAGEQLLLLGLLALLWPDQQHPQQGEHRSEHNQAATVQRSSSKPAASEASASAR